MRRGARARRTAAVTATAAAATADADHHDGRDAASHPRAARAGVTDTSIKVGGLGYSFVYGGADIGAKARFQRANDAGGVNGRTIDYVGFTDDGGDPTAGTAAATKLVEQDGVFAVVPTVTPDLAASSYLVEQKVPYFGWALSSNFCGNRYGFGFTGCPVPEGATSNAWPLLISKVFAERRERTRGGDRHREHAVGAVRPRRAQRRGEERQVQGRVRQGRRSPCRRRPTTTRSPRRC